MLPKLIIGLAPVADQLVLLAEDGSAYTTPIARPGPLQPFFPFGERWGFASQVGLIVSARGTLLEVIDVDAHARWTLATATHTAFTSATISPDGSRVLALTSTRALAWKLDLPATPAATATFLDGLTNAYDKGAGELGWR